MGGSNLQQAFPNYLTCLRFIRISTETWLNVNMLFEALRKFLKRAEPTQTQILSESSVALLWKFKRYSNTRYCITILSVNTNDQSDIKFTYLSVRILTILQTILSSLSLNVVTDIHSVSSLIAKPIFLTT